jgi:hypothetical protein
MVQGNYGSDDYDVYQQATATDVRFAHPLCVCRLWVCHCLQISLFLKTLSNFRAYVLFHLKFFLVVFLFLAVLNQVHDICMFVYCNSVCLHPLLCVSQTRRMMFR